jgi:cation:H+ antiporter
MGAVFLGVITSLSGIVTSVSAAYNNHPELAVSNAVGGIALQTLFLAIADLSYPKANLEHASASFTNLLQSILLILLLAFILMVTFTKEITFFGVHPAALILLVIYLAVQRMITRAQKKPMWNPVNTSDTKPDIPEKPTKPSWSTTTTMIVFVISAILIVFAGYFIMRSAVVIAENTFLSTTIVGALFTALATSLPELVVSVSAVRQKALTLAVANIIGGNTFDVLFISFSDIAYRNGSIFHTFESSHFFIFLMTMVMTSILALGLLHRQRHGIGGIGWESWLIIIIFLAGYRMLFIM